MAGAPFTSTSSSVATGSSKTYEFTSQLFFNDALTDSVYTQSPYS